MAMRRVVLVALALLVLAGCGSEEERFVKDGTCYERRRAWVIWQTQNDTYVVKCQ